LAKVGHSVSNLNMPSARSAGRQKPISAGNVRFAIFMAVTLIVFVGILLFVMRKRSVRPSPLAIGLISLVVVIGGMLFAKLGNNAGWPVWIYYAIPALTTLVLPPIALRMAPRTELWQYLILAFASSPVIHVGFSFLVGWHDYLPFFYVPALSQLLR
jgi:hypothetical protein